MKPKYALTKLAPLLKEANFTCHEAKALGVTSMTLAYYARTGSLIRIGRGVYRGAHSPSMEDFRWEDLTVTMTKIKNGVICLTTALAIYEMTDEIPRKHWIAIHNKTRHRADSSTKIVRMRNMELGKTTIKINNMKLPIFDRERTIVDAFRFLSIETAIKALRAGLALTGKEKINLEKIRKYSKILRVKIDPYLLGVTT